MKYFERLDTTTTVTGGTVKIFRNPAGRKFGKKDAVEITENWGSSIWQISQALGRARRKAAQQCNGAFAWNARFGYLSPLPEHVGCGIEVQADLFLPALGLLGEFCRVVEAFRAMHCETFTISADGIDNVAYFMTMRSNASLGLTEKDFVFRQHYILHSAALAENTARQRLFSSDRIVLADAVERSIAILGSAKLLPEWEVPDLLAPLFLAAEMDCLAGIDFDEVDDMLYTQLVNGTVKALPQTPEEDRELEREDRQRAREINRRFAKVRINKHGERLFYG